MCVCTLACVAGPCAWGWRWNRYLPQLFLKHSTSLSGELRAHQNGLVYQAPLFPGFSIFLELELQVGHHTHPALRWVWGSKLSSSSLHGKCLIHGAISPAPIIPIITFKPLYAAVWSKCTLGILPRRQTPTLLGRNQELVLQNGVHELFSVICLWLIILPASFTPPHKTFLVLAKQCPTLPHPIAFYHALLAPSTAASLSVPCIPVFPCPNLPQERARWACTCALKAQPPMSSFSTQDSTLVYPSELGYWIAISPGRETATIVTVGCSTDSQMSHAIEEIFFFFFLSLNLCEMLLGDSWETYYPLSAHR